MPVILLIDDNPEDAMLIIDAFKELSSGYKFYTVKDGVEALAFLKKTDSYTNAPRPDLILLDLNMPKKDGYDVLKEIKSESELKIIPIIVLTSSAAQKDVYKAYDFHANSYIVKTSDIGHLNEIVKSIEKFWFHIVKLPVLEK